MTLRTVLRDNETFSAHLTDRLSVPAPVVQSLLSARVTLVPVSMVDIPSDSERRRNCLQDSWQPRWALARVYLTENVAGAAYLELH